MEEKNQAKPFAPAGYQLRSDHHHHHEVEDHERDQQSKIHCCRKRLYVQCCGCLAVLFLIPVVVIIVILTVFHIRTPGITVNSVTIQRQLEAAAAVDHHHGAPSVGSGDGGDVQNMTLLVDVSMKNPNYSSFRYGNARSVVYCGGVEVGEGRIPEGLARARRTLRMNVSVDVDGEKMSRVDVMRSSGALNMSSYTRIDGKIKMLKIIKKIVVLRFNCTFTYNVFSQTIQDDNCSKSMYL